jgi:two-component system KDP operon response regulator KdpE
MNSSSIIIVDDEAGIRRILSKALQRDGYIVTEADSARAALDLIPQRQPVVVLLDLGLPDLDGLELVPRIRQLCTAAIIVVSARNTTDMKIAALDHGAEDYIVKPFDLEELLARVRSAVRRRLGGAAVAACVKAGDLEIDISRRQVCKSGEIVHLTRKEYEVLATLASAPGRILTHNAILERAWPLQQNHNVEYLYSLVRHLRLKIETDPTIPTVILNEPGVGYRLNANS